MPNHIPLTKLNKHRFPLEPRPMTTLRYQARHKLLPGSFLQGGNWMVDLDVFDAAVREQTDPGAPSPASNDAELDQRASAILDQLEGKAKAA
jgi:hypothetical protein